MGTIVYLYNNIMILAEIHFLKTCAKVAKVIVIHDWSIIIKSCVSTHSHNVVHSLRNSSQGIVVTSHDNIIYNPFYTALHSSRLV